MPYILQDSTVTPVEQHVLKFHLSMQAELPNPLAL